MEVETRSVAVLSKPAAIGVSLEGLLLILMLRPIIAFIASVDETW